MEFVDVDDGRGVDELSFDWKNVDVGWITAGIFEWQRHFHFAGRNNEIRQLFR